MKLIRSGCVLVLFFCAAIAVRAQEEVPKVEVFTGYSFNTFGNQDGLHGGTASVTFNVNRWFGLTADFSAGAQPFSGDRQVTFLFGPRVSKRWERATLFGHALFGAARTRVDFSSPLPDITDGSFSYALGGGLDIHAGRYFAIRAIQADYMYTKPFGSDRDSFRISTGVVFRFGSR